MMSLLAGVSVPLILASTASGEVLGIKAVKKFVDPADIAADVFIAGVTSLLVVNVYVEFSPGDTNAWVNGVGGSAAFGIFLEINTRDGTFFQHPQGRPDHRTPSAGFAAVPGFNTLKHDSFVTIGRKLDDDPIGGLDQTQIIGLNSWTDTQLTGSTEIAWFIAGFPSQGDPGSAPDNPPDEVLVAQFTIANPGPDAVVFGTMFVNALHTNADGVVEQFFVAVVIEPPPPPPPVCPADLNGDGRVSVPDLLALLAAWGTEPAGPPDLDGDGIVSRPDLMTLLAAWGPCQ